jgi:hypothetical protein
VTKPIDAEIEVRRLVDHTRRCVNAASVHDLDFLLQSLDGLAECASDLSARIRDLRSRLGDED